MTDASQSNRGTRRHPLPYPMIRIRMDGAPMRSVLEIVFKELGCYNCKASTA